MTDSEHEHDAIAWNKHREQQHRRYGPPRLDKPTTEKIIARALDENDTNRFGQC